MIPDWKVIIPDITWQEHGSWRDTLRQEISKLDFFPKTMDVVSVNAYYHIFSKFPHLYGIQSHDRGRQWVPLKEINGYEYCWDTIDGRGLDELHIRGPFDQEIAEKILAKLEEVGVTFDDGRWAAMVQLYE